MNVLLTGSAGRVGRALRARLRAEHAVLSIDRLASPATDRVADIGDAAAMREAVHGMDAVVHVAALHAPHVGVHDEAAFQRVNVEATAQLARAAAAAGVRRFVFTSSTAVYGSGAASGPAHWVDESTTPAPRTVYHRSKLAAEAALRVVAAETGLAVTVLRMSRCFPEPAPLMAVYRLHRGIDARDVAEAHARVLQIDIDERPEALRCWVLSGATPFEPGDAARLGTDAPAVLRERAPALAAAFAERGWSLPSRLDRVYVPRAAEAALGWRTAHGWASVLAQLDGGDPETLPPAATGAGDGALSRKTPGRPEFS